MDTATRSTTTSAGRARSSRRSARFFAAEIAAAYAAATSAAEDTQEEILWVAMEVAQHLADRGHAGDWDRIDGAALGRFTLTGDLDDRVCFLRLAAPMLVWLAETRQMEGATVATILESLGAAVSTCARSDRIVKRALARLENSMRELAAVPEPIEVDATIPIAVEESAPHAGLEGLDVMVVAPASESLIRGASLVAIEADAIEPSKVDPLARTPIEVVEAPARRRSVLLPTVQVRGLDATGSHHAADADRPEDLPPEAA